MTVRIMMIAGFVVGVAAVGTIYADNVPMVERHIFIPEAINEQKEEAPVAPVATVSALEKEIQFTGVIVTAKGKQAIISEIAKNDKSKQKRAITLKEGEQIKGMTVKEIGANYVVLNTKENTVRMDLYKGAKMRPAPAAEPVDAQSKQKMSADAQPPAAAKNNTKSANESPAEDTPAEKPLGSPFGGANAGKSVEDRPVNAGSESNPFIDILKRGGRTPASHGNEPVTLPFNLPQANQ